MNVLHNCGSISIFYNYTMWKTISGKSVCANPQDSINEKQSFLSVDNGVPLMYKQKITAFLCFFFIKNPVFPIFVKKCPLCCDWSMYSFYSIMFTSLMEIVVFCHGHRRIVSRCLIPEMSFILVFQD